ncbi:hypothetical protein NA29_25755 [Pandoraea sputorum]|nr:hypothetical protein NA29_25755 [Pandoraea sputorum]
MTAEWIAGVATAATAAAAVRRLADIFILADLRNFWRWRARPLRDVRVTARHICGVRIVMSNTL